MGNPFAALNKALEVLDGGAREASGKCPRCGRDRGGIVPPGQTKADSGICDCDEREEEDEAELSLALPSYGGPDGWEECVSPDPEDWELAEAQQERCRALGLR